MLGAIIGDLAGSIYEYDQVSKVKPLEINNIIDKNSFFSDDTILTIAIADAIISKCDYGKKLKKYATKYANYIPKFSPYFPTIFSPNFEKWAKGNFVGTSKGNGAMMRISPVGYMFNSEEDIVKNVKLATSPSHNSKEAITHATTIALIIFYARKGLSKEEIKKKLNLKISKPILTKFNYTCKDTIDLCLYSLFEGNSFDEYIKLALSFGGDTDTNACIVGSMAESFYSIPKDLINQALAKLPNEFIEILNQYYII